MSNTLPEISGVAGIELWIIEQEYVIASFLLIKESPGSITQSD